MTTPIITGMQKSRLRAMAVPITSRDRTQQWRSHTPPEKLTGFEQLSRHACARSRRDDAKLGGESLEKDRHQVRGENYSEECVSELGTAGEIGGPVAGIHVADRDEVSRSGERGDLPPPAFAADGDGSINLDQ
jgi:hypothetical protein